jgi:molybdate transport system substrate-binding protein
MHPAHFIMRILVMIMHIPGGDPMKIAARFLPAIFAWMILCQFCAAQDFTVAAAADLQSAMQDVAARFEKQTGKAVKVTYGSSGNFFQQIQNGAPFDMFFSANLDYPKKLERAGLVESGSYYGYGKGKIVVWVPNDSKLDISSGLKSLLDPKIGKVAVANPQHAPYGQAAVAAMRKEGIYDRVKDKFVLGENISQTASFAVSGAADVGVVALSLALSPNMKDKGRYAEIPEGDYPPIEQACVILSSSKNKDTAKQFLAFVKSAAVADILVKYGFDVPREEK